MKMFRDWTKFEKTWLAVFTLINLYLFFAWDDTILALISSLSGMLCVVLVAKGKISNYYFGFIQASTYAYIAWTYNLYGEAMLNAMFYVPVQFVGIYMWRKSKLKESESTQGEDVIVNSLNKKQWIYTIIGSSIAIALYAILLEKIGGRKVGLDSATNVLSIVAQILMLYRFTEQWLIWIGVNVLSIVLWFTALSMTGGNDYTILIMWIAFLFNSIYGYYNWRKVGKEQTNV